MNNIEKLALEHGKASNTVMRYNEMSQQMLLDGYNFTKSELEAFAKALQSSQPITVTDLLLKNGIEPSRADFADVLNVLQQSSEPVGHVVDTPNMYGAVLQQGLKHNTLLFTQTTSPVPLEKLLDALNSPYAHIEIDATKETITVVDKPSHITVEVFTKHQISQALKAIAEAEGEV